MVGVVSAKIYIPQQQNMNIKDEVLVKIVVANICPNIIYNVESEQYEELTEN